MDHLPLGKPTTYTDIYTPSLLCRIDRQSDRSGYPERLPFYGVDIWNAYELSWLNKKGKPIVAVASFYIPAKSRYTVESKSLKLYLNSFNQTPFASAQEVHEALSSDLKATVQQDVPLMLQCNDHRAFLHVQRLMQQPPNALEASMVNWEDGIQLDHLDIAIDHYQPSEQLLAVDTGRSVSETLVSHLLKSNCPVTGQPDWASILIRYRGHEILPDSMLRYLVGFRQHQDFHEACVERIFMDIWRQCQPEKLTVYARYTRRGGIDINPFRSNYEAQIINAFAPRQ